MEFKLRSQTLLHKQDVRENHVTLFLTRQIRAIVSFPDGRLATASRDATITVWNPDSSEAPISLHGHQNWVSALCVLPNGKENSAKLACDVV
jgi:WD40 repeat protein